MRANFISVVLFLFSIFSFELCGNLEQPKSDVPSIVFVYISSSLPTYIQDSVYQARLFNPDANIFIIAPRKCFQSRKQEKISVSNVHLVACEDLKKTEEHKLFDERCLKESVKGPSKYINERFLYIDELMQKYDLHDVFQVECDVMLYFNLSENLWIFHQHYPKMAAPFENDQLGSVSFVYFSDSSASHSYASYMASEGLEGDMRLIAKYKNSHTADEIDYLPIIFKEYADDRPLKSKLGQTTSNPEKFYNHIEEFCSVFDSDLLGTYLSRDPGTIGNQVLYDPSYFKIVWEKDSFNRKVPYIYYKTVKYRLNTLHVHPKNLLRFAS